MNFHKDAPVSGILQYARQDNLFDAPLFTLIDGQHFSIRQLNLATDLPIIYEWVNQSYAIPFWQLNGTFEQLLQVYQEVMASAHGHSFVGCLNNQIVCQVDVYDPFHDTVSDFYPVSEGDIGVHMLIAPGKKPVLHFSSKVLYLIITYLFFAHGVQRVIAEPDERNLYANQLLVKMQFERLGRLQMSHKNAQLYAMQKEQFRKLAYRWMPIKS